MSSLIAKIFKINTATGGDKYVTVFKQRLKRKSIACLTFVTLYIDYVYGYTLIQHLLDNQYRHIPYLYEFFNFFGHFFIINCIVNWLLAAIIGPGKAGYINWGSFDRCNKCKLRRAARAHHCKICQICVLKMDHHCDWIGNCAGFANYKFFVLFLFYVFLSCWIWIWALVIYCYESWYFQDMKSYFPGIFNKIFLFYGLFNCLFFGAWMVPFSLQHVFGSFMNLTTIEVKQIIHLPQFKSKWDIGKLANWNQVMGDNPLVWFIPTSPPIDNEGSWWPKKPKPRKQYEEANNIEATTV